MKKDIKILELSKDYAKKFYNGDYKKMIDEMDGVLYDDENIKYAFNNGNGSFNHLIDYINANRKQAKYYDLNKRCYI
jgi:hypothetical protein